MGRKDRERYHRALGVSIEGPATQVMAAMTAPNPLFLREEELDRGLELLFLAGHQLSGDAAELREGGDLDPLDHHLLFLVDRRPGITLAELCLVLGVRKQTLSRHLKDLAAAGLIEQEASALDRRKRPLRLTEPAEALLAGIKTAQKRRLRQAFKKAGASAVEGFQQVLMELVGEPRRELAGRQGAVTRTT